MNSDRDEAAGFSIDSFIENNSGLLKLSTDFSNENKLANTWDVSGGQTAFLGPNIWNAPCDDNFKLELFNLDELLSDTVTEEDTLLGIGDVALSPIPTDIGSTSEEPDSGSGSSSSRMLFSSTSPRSSGVMSVRIKPSHKREYPDTGDEADDVMDTGEKVKVSFRVPSPDLALASVPGLQFDPARRQFTSDELRPQPVCKKSKKRTIESEQKDDDYWSRRKKNNMAAKRSRDAKRLKENQIMLRTNFLESENNVLKKKLSALTSENKQLKHRLSNCVCLK